jgi:hypothetical protein
MEFEDDKNALIKGMGFFNSGEIKTKLLTLPLLWASTRALQSVHFLTWVLDSRQFHVNPISIRRNCYHKVTRTAF